MWVSRGNRCKRGGSEWGGVEREDGLFKRAIFAKMLQVTLSRSRRSYVVHSYLCLILCLYCHQYSLHPLMSCSKGVHPSKPLPFWRPIRSRSLHCHHRHNPLHRSVLSTLFFQLPSLLYDQINQFRSVISLFSVFTPFPPFSHTIASTRLCNTTFHNAFSFSLSLFSPSLPEPFLWSFSFLRTFVWQLCEHGSLIISGFAISARNRHTDIDFKQTQGMSLWSYSLHGKDRYVLEKKSGKGGMGVKVRYTCLSVGLRLCICCSNCTCNVPHHAPCIGLSHYVLPVLFHSWTLFLNCAPLCSLCLSVVSLSFLKQMLDCRSCQCWR